MGWTIRVIIRVVCVASSVVALALSGCGDTADKKAVVSVVKQYVKAADRGDHATECALLTSHARDALLGPSPRGITEPGNPVPRRVTSCTQALSIREGGFHSRITADPLAFSGLKEPMVHIHGASATVDGVTVPVFRGPFKLVKVHGRWLFSKKPS